MRHLAFPFAVILSAAVAAVAYGQTASHTRVEILDTASATIDRSAFNLFRTSIRDALQAAGYDPVLSGDTLAGYRSRGDARDGFCIDITEASASNRLSGATPAATSPTGGVIIPAWEGLATFEVNVLEARSSDVLATYRFSGVDTGLVGGSAIRGRAAGGVFRPSDPLLGYLVGGIFNATRHRQRDAVTAVARDVTMRMKEDLEQK